MITRSKKDFQAADRYHTCNKFYNATNSRIKDHSQVTRKYRGFGYRSFIANFKLTKVVTCYVSRPSKILQLFHNAGFC